MKDSPFQWDLVHSEISVERCTHDQYLWWGFQVVRLDWQSHPACSAVEPCNKKNSLKGTQVGAHFVHMLVTSKPCSSRVCCRPFCWPLSVIIFWILPCTSAASLMPLPAHALANSMHNLGDATGLPCHSHFMFLCVWQMLLKCLMMLCVISFLLLFACSLTSNQIQVPSHNTTVMPANDTNGLCHAWGKFFHVCFLF